MGKMNYSRPQFRSKSGPVGAGTTSGGKWKSTQKRQRVGFIYMRAKYSGLCHACEKTVDAGSQIAYDSVSKKIYHRRCT